MDFARAVLDWFAVPDHWSGTSGIGWRLAQHVAYSTVATVIAAALAVPVGLALGHTGRYGNVAINVSNVGRAVPTFGLLVIAFLLAPFSLLPVFVALVALAIPPILTNTYVGVRQVDAEARDAAIGTGMTGTQVLWRVEAPIAAPLVMAGIRLSAVQVTATATLAAVAGFGGLGRFIIDGFATRDYPEVVAGALLAAALAVVVDLLLAAAERLVTPRGLARAGVPRQTPADPAAQPS